MTLQEQVSRDTGTPSIPEIDLQRQLSFDDVYDAQFDFVWRVVCRCGASSQVDDLVQQVFIVVHRQLPQFEGRSSIRTWLYTIIRRVVKDHFRGKARRGRSEPIDDALLPAVDRTPEEQVARKEDIELLYRLLDTLDEEKREVFVLVELEGMSVAELARGLRVNENTLYARLRAARQQFNEAVGRHQAATKRRER